MVIDPSTLGLNDPLLKTSVEVYAIDDDYAELESQIEAIQKNTKSEISRPYQEKKISTPEDAEWHIANQDV